MRIAICEDEGAQQELLKTYMKEWAAARRIPLDIVLFCSAESLLFQWEDDSSFDLLALDIEMRQINGIKLAETLRKKGEDIPILFITGYDRYMAQGYEVSAIHYLMKPVCKEKLFSVLDRLQQTGKAEEKLLLPIEDGNLAICPSQIWYIEAAGHQCILADAKRRFSVKQPISVLMKLLDGRQEIVRCHRSYLVNLRHVSAVIRSGIIMDDGVRIPMSRSAEKQVNEAFIRNYTC